MALPKSAVRSMEGRTVVFVVNGDRVERRAITVGDQTGEQIDVVSGVRQGERVVVDVPATMKDGDRIKVQ
jgi:hypothetical protein